MNIALKFFFLFLLCILLGLGAGYVAMETLPCHWFGSNFEGACGYGVLFAAIGVGFVVLVLSFGILSYLTVRTSSLPSRDAGGALPKSLQWTWLASLTLYLASPLFVFLGHGSLIDTAASVLALAFFLSTSMVVARRKGKNPMLAFIALIPIVGVIVVAFVLFAKPKLAAEEGN
jgi:hypothetical protein